MNASRRLWDKLGSFEDLDVDGDGSISRSELRTALEALRDHDCKLRRDGHGSGADSAPLAPSSTSISSVFQRHRRRDSDRSRIPIARGASGIDLLIDDLQRVADEDGDRRISRAEFERLKKSEDKK